jgi:uncharacterized protein
VSESEGMSRRLFLSRTSRLLFAGLFSLTPFRKAFAQGFPSPPGLFALIIDDIGHSIPHARQFLGLGLPLTFSVLPRLAHSAELSEELRGRGYEVMLHQPMEPYNRSIDPGPGALFVGDEPRLIDEVMEQNIGGVPLIVGVNNHMGSRFTEDRTGIEEALKVIKRNGLFFIDSLTTNRSVGFSTARQLSMPSAARNLFVDFQPEPCAILRELERLSRLAARHGTAIGIGHPYPETAEAIAGFAARRETSNARMAPISEIIAA